MNDWEEIFIEHTKEDINTAIDQAIAIKRNYITINHLDRDIYFNYIKDKKRKIRHYSLPQPEQKKLAYTPEQNIEVQKKIDKMMEITYEWRKRNFMNNRQVILEKLAKTEKQFEVTTTLDKLEELNLLRQKQILLDIK